MDSNPSELHHLLTNEVEMSKHGFVSMGKLLYELKSNDSYLQAVGEGIETWQSYLAQPEIGLSVGEANRLIQIYETFVLKFGIEEGYLASVPVKNLHYLLPMAKYMDEVSENGEEHPIHALLADAAHLSQRDFRERVRDLQNDDGVRTYEYIIMRKCRETGGMRKVHDIESEVIKTTFGLDDGV